jgi:hypothetical protein
MVFDYCRSCSSINPMPYEHAVQMEKDLADDLRAQGYAVCGGT